MKLLLAEERLRSGIRKEEKGKEVEVSSLESRVKSSARSFFSPSRITDQLTQLTKV